MNMILEKNVRKASIVAAVSIAVIAVLYMIINNINLNPGRSHMVVFDYVGTINRGSLVRKSGLKIGTVRDLRISPADHRSVEVRIALDRGHIVRTEDRFAVVTRGILGDQYIEVFPGPIDSPVAEQDHVFAGMPVLDFNSLIVQGGELMENLLASTAALNRMLNDNESSVRRTVESIERLTASLEPIVGSAEELERFVPELRRELTDSMKTLSDSVASLAHDTGRLIASLDTELDRTSVTLNRSLVSVADAAEQLNRLLTELNREDSFLATLNRPDTAQDIVAILRNVETTTGNLMTSSAEIRKSIEDLLGSGETR
jgi:phospholipid/cholesterol/gamma-HCH transport system substrate-binding protein